MDGTGKPALDAPEVPTTEAPTESQQWSSGLGEGGSCPAAVSTTVTIGGYSAPVNFSFDTLCQFAGYLRVVFLSMGALMSALIIAGVRK